MAWTGFPDPCYTINFCPNPSVETNLTGYAALIGTEQIAQDSQAAYSGNYGLSVTTPGNVPGEGVSTPAGSILADATGSATVYVGGETGTLTIQAVQNPGGQVLGTTQVVLNGQGWQRAELDNLGLVEGDTLQLVIFTTLPQAITFWVDAIQYEPESPAHPYIDGDSQYGVWTGTPELSPSYQEFQNPTSLQGGMTLEGTIEVVALGEIFQITTVISGLMDMSGLQHDMAAVSGTRTVIQPAIDPGVPGLPWVIAGGGSITSVAVLSPGPGFSDFAIFETGVDPDPAIVLIGYNNAGTENASETATSYAQVFGTFSPPQQSLDSGGNARWQAAAYMAAGFRIASQAAWAAGAPGSVNFTDIQVEKTTTQNGPTSYQLPRSLNTIIKPTRMNYVTNPSFETGDDTGWTAIGGATMTVVSGGYEGNYSLQVSVPGAGGGVYIMVPDLILGDTYAASAYVRDTSGNINDITLSASGLSVSSVATGYPYGAGEYGSGPYGGIANAADDMGTDWFRPWTPFVAGQSTVVLSIVPVAVTGATYPLVFDLDCVLVEPGEVLNSYGDGSTDGWQWELGGTPGVARSYYYERQSVAASAIEGVLGQHIPLGLTAYEPMWAIPPTQ